jgi:hypothetical protein
MGSRSYPPLDALTRAAGSLRRPLDTRPRVDVPRQGDYVHVRNSIECPAAGNQDVEVINYTVPAGFNLVFSHILCFYLGVSNPPDYEGDANQLFYSVMIDNTFFAKQFDQITSSLGSLNNGPYPIPGHMFFEENRLIQGLVTVPALSSIATGEGNRIHFHLIGWQWPLVLADNLPDRMRR